MNKAELINEVAKKTGFSNKDSGAAVNAVFDAISTSLKKKDPVRLIGFGTFETVKRAARKGKNPQTGEAMKIPARKVPKFKPGKALKELVAK